VLSRAQSSSDDERVARHGTIRHGDCRIGDR
jgi:hypothetical protein